MKDELLGYTTFSYGWCWTVKPPALPGGCDALGSVAGRAHSEPSSSYVGVSPEPHQQFHRTQSCWVSETVVLVLINFWKNKERKHLQPHVSHGPTSARCISLGRAEPGSHAGCAAVCRHPLLVGALPRAAESPRSAWSLPEILQLWLLLHGIFDVSPPL